jgi:hypothetical protein
MVKIITTDEYLTNTPEEDDPVFFQAGDYLRLDQQELGWDLEKEIWERAGLKNEDVLAYSVVEHQGVSIKLEKGWHLVVEPDDYTCALFRDGEPVAGFYVSTRGALYQAGAWIEADKSAYHANNLTEPMDEWVKIKESIDSDIAHDFLQDLYKGAKR